jgi:putative transcriptional regulator
MPIIVNLDVMMAKRKMSLNELSEKVDLTLSNLSILKTGKQKQSVFQRSKPFAKCWSASPPTFWNIREK